MGTSTIDPREVLGWVGQNSGSFHSMSACAEAYTSDSSKMSFMVELLTRHALKWAQAVLKARPDLSYNDFLAKFCCLAKAWARMQLNTKCSTFGKVREAWLISQLTFGYWQRTWTFLKSLNEDLKWELSPRELPKSLDALISMCVLGWPHAGIWWASFLFLTTPCRVRFWGSEPRDEGGCWGGATNAARPGPTFALGLEEMAVGVCVGFLIYYYFFNFFFLCGKGTLGEIMQTHALLVWKCRHVSTNGDAGCVRYCWP